MKYPATRSTIEDIARCSDVTPEIVARIFEAILNELMLNRTVAIAKFGKFKPGTTGYRRYSTPIISGEVVAEARRCIRFNQAKHVSQRLNGG